VGAFVQIIEFRTSRIDDVQALMQDMRRRREAEGRTGPRRVTLTADRDHVGRYLNVVEFDSYEAAMQNSADPETGRFAEQMAKLCDGPPTFRNLDVVLAWDR